LHAERREKIYWVIKGFVSRSLSTMTMMMVRNVYIIRSTWKWKLHFWHFFFRGAIKISTVVFVYDSSKTSQIVRYVDSSGLLVRLPNCRCWVFTQFYLFHYLPMKVNFKLEVTFLDVSKVLNKPKLNLSDFLSTF
jgi:hypothetical protein